MLTGTARYHQPPRYDYEVALPSFDRITERDKNRLAEGRLYRVFREWCSEVKHWQPVGGGWIRTQDGAGRTVGQGWHSVFNDHRYAIADWLTAKLTAQVTFGELIKAEGGYRPTLMVCCRRDWRYALLADLYDEAQRRRGDERRAERGIRHVKAEAQSDDEERA